MSKAVKHFKGDHQHFELGPEADRCSTGFICFKQLTPEVTVKFLLSTALLIEAFKMSSNLPRIDHITVVIQYGGYSCMDQCGYDSKGQIMSQV